MSIWDHPHPALTVDVAAFSLREGDLQVLLIQRADPPFEGSWALPGGFVDLGEPPEDAARRELEEETGVRDIRLEQLRVFGEPGRDPRGHVVSVVYLALLPAQSTTHIRASDDAADARCWPVHGLPALAFDHAEVLACALRRLREALEDPVGSGLLPDAFTVGELRAVWKAVRGAEL